MMMSAIFTLQEEEEAEEEELSKEDKANQGKTYPNVDRGKLFVCRLHIHPS